MCRAYQSSSICADAKVGLATVNNLTRQSRQIFHGLQLARHLFYCVTIKAQLFHLFTFSHHCNDLRLNGLWPVRSISN